MAPASRSMLWLLWLLLLVLLIGRFDASLPFLVSGACGKRDNCVTSRNYPKPYGSRYGFATESERFCAVSITRDVYLSVSENFEVGEDSKLTMRDVDCSIRSAVPSSLNAGEMLSWQTGFNNTAIGWEICFSDAIEEISRIGAGCHHTMILDVIGAVFTAGLNNRGQLGDETWVARSTFMKVVTSGAMDFAAGCYHTVVLKDDGAVLTVGYNGCGQLGDARSDTRNKFETVVMSGAIGVAAGELHTVILKNSGAVYTVGFNGYGQLGDGTTDEKNIFEEVVSSGVISVAAGLWHTIILKDDRSVHTAGCNRYGQLGDGTTVDKKTFVEVAMSGTFGAAGDFHTVILQGNGGVLTVGGNINGQLGDGKTVNRNMSVEVFATGIIGVAAGGRHSVILEGHGAVHTVGSNSKGQLGDFTTIDRNTFLEVVTSGVISVAAGGHHTVILKNDGSVHAVGDNSYGQLGDGTTRESNQFVKVVDHQIKSSTTTTSTRVAWGCTTAFAFGCATCVPQANRTNDTHCATCNNGYYESDGTCQAWGCMTATSIGCATCAPQANRTSDTHCASCNHGFYESRGACHAAASSGIGGSIAIWIVLVLSIIGFFCVCGFAICMYHRRVKTKKTAGVVHQPTLAWGHQLLLKHHKDQSLPSESTTNWATPAIELSHAQTKVSTSRQLGIGYDFVIRVFPDEVKEKCRRFVHDILQEKDSLSHDEHELVDKCSSPDLDIHQMNFYDLAQIAAYGELAYGKGRICPRDGREDCSIVDAISESGYSWKAKFFISWCWAYSFGIAFSALRNFRNSHGSLPDDEWSFWWCFFANNQFRILGAAQQQPFESLQQVFGANLEKIGRMVCMLDRVRDSAYSRRLWCLFEVHVAASQEFPMEVMVPSEALQEIEDLVKEGGFENLSRALLVDASTACATFEDDEKGIQALIKTLPEGYKTINRKVQKALWTAVSSLMAKAAEPTSFNETRWYL